MRSHRVAESPLDRARGVVRIERLDYPAPDPLARGSARAGEAPSLRRPARAGRGLEPGSRRAP